MHEQQILHERYLYGYAFALPHDQFPNQRSEHFNPHFSKHLVSGKFSVVSFEVAHYKPLQVYFLTSGCTASANMAVDVFLQIVYFRLSANLLILQVMLSS